MFIESAFVDASLVDPDDLARRLELSLTGVSSNNFPLNSANTFSPKLTLDDTFEPVPSEG